MLTTNGPMNLSIDVPRAIAAPMSSRCAAHDGAGLRKSDPNIAIVRLESERGQLYVMALIANFALITPAGGEASSAVRYQLDDDSPVLISYGASNSPVTFVAFTFTSVHAGNHRLSVALVTKSGKVLAYEQRCPRILSHRFTTYDIRRLPLGGSRLIS
jgi:hypothetical protein